MKKFLSLLLIFLVIVSLFTAALASSVRTTGDVWLRKGPGKNYSKIRAISKGTKLSYTGKSSVDYRGVRWYRVKYNGSTGWVSSRYAKLSGSSSSSSSSSKSSSKKSSSSSSSKSSATATPAPEPEVTPTPEPEISSGEIVEHVQPDGGVEGTEEVPTFTEAPIPVELSLWYLENLEKTATDLSLSRYQLNENSDFRNQYSNEVLLIAGDTTTEHFRITGEGYAVYGVSVGMDMETAVTTLNNAGLFRTDNSILGESFQHLATTNSPVNVNGFDSFINLIGDASGKVSEISWSIYTGDWTTDTSSAN